MKESEYESIVDGMRLINGPGARANALPTLTTPQSWLEDQVMAERQTTRNSHNFQDLSNRVFGRLRVVRREEKEPRKIAFWRCVCECGREYVAATYYLTSGACTNCGCQRSNKQRKAYQKFIEQNPQPVAVAIELKAGVAAIVDAADYPAVAKHHWTAHRGNTTTYARALIDGTRILLHVFLMGAKEGCTVDHANGNGLDNRRLNLRHATPSQQMRNIHGGRGRSLYKGVSWANRQRKWVATISVDGKNRHLGYFDVEDDAARAYDAAARLHYGEFACLNFPENVDVGE